MVQFIKMATSGTKFTHNQGIQYTLYESYDRKEFKEFELQH